MFCTDCSQSPIFSWDRLDILRLTVTGILIFKCTEGAGVGDYNSVGGGALFFSLPPIRPRPLSSFDTHVRWQPVTQSARSRWSYGKREDCEQSMFCTHEVHFHFIHMQRQRRPRTRRDKKFLSERKKSHIWYFVQEWISYKKMHFKTL